MSDQRLTVVLGAGFSQSLGINGTAEITSEVEAKLAQFGEPYNELRSRLKKRFRDNYNFEVLAGALEACGVYGKPSLIPDTPPFQSVLPDVAQLYPTLTPDLAGQMYEALVQIVMRAVAFDWQAAANPEKLTAIRSNFEALSAQYALDIATFNYDTGAEEFVPSAVDGFDETRAPYEFNARSFVEANGPKIAHLHGSASFAISPEHRVVRLPGQPKPGQGRLWDRKTNGSFFSALITGVNKAEKLTMPPFTFYYQWLSNQLVLTPRVLVIGFGVADPHINVWLAQAAQFHGADLRIAIIDKFEDRPPNGPFSLFALSAGVQSVADGDKLLQDLPFVDGFASTNGALLGNMGWPLDEKQMHTLLSFLA